MGMAKIAVESKAKATGRRGRARRVVLLTVVAAALIGGVWKLWELRRYRRAMVEIQQEIRAGRHGHAARKAAMLLAWKPDSDEATYLLGVCEKARGQAQAAFGAWERVSPGSPFGAQAIQGRMELLIERGRLADAETLIIQAMSDPRGDGSKLGLFLGLVYSLQGRVEERERVIEACWDRLERGGRRGIGVGHSPRSPPHPDPDDRGDPRVPRSGRTVGPGGRPGLAGEGQTGDPRRRVRRGLAMARSLFRRRPDDVAVWRARLDWALATHRLADVRQALGHLPVEESNPAQVQRLTAWLAAFRGDLDSERRALERLVEVDSADLPALDRLEAIADKEREPDRSANTGTGRARSADSRLVTKSSTSATRQCATPRRWPAWRSSSVGRSRRRSSGPSRWLRSRSTARRFRG